MTIEGVDLELQVNKAIELQFFTKDNNIYILSEDGEWVQVSEEIIVG